MARKKKKDEVLQDLPVDKMDAFIMKNYKTIIVLASALVILFIGGYGVFSFMGNQKVVKAESIGEAELAGLFSDEQINSYIGLASTLSFEKDYIHLTAAERLAMLGSKDKAIEQLKLVGGKYAEYAKSLNFDLAGGTVDKMDKNGRFSSLWYYREILTAKDNRAQLLEEFRTAWPNSVLLEKLENWGLE